MRFAVLFVGFFLFAAPLEAQTVTPVSELKVTVGDGPSFLRRLARVATLGIIQASADSIRRDTPFVFAADHDGIDTTAYNLRINTQLQQTAPVTALSNGTIRFAFPQGLPRGSYSLVVEATGEGGTTPSSPLSLSVTAGNPAAPRNPRIEK